MNAEEKENQIIKTITEIEGESLSQEDEFQILSGKGIVKKCNELELIIPVLTIGQQEVLFEISNILSDNTLKTFDKLKVVVSKLSVILKVSDADLKDNCTQEDLRDIVNIMTYSLLKGKRIFEKKSVTVKDIQAYKNI